MLQETVYKNMKKLWPINKLYKMRDELTIQIEEIKCQELKLESQSTELKHQQELLKQQQDELESYKKSNYDDLWMTKFGYDTMISDLQMSAIERILPGNRKKILELKDSHKGEQCFVIGNGPSLRIEDLNLLKANKKFTFAAKRINLIFDKTDWRPDIWSASDLDYIERYQDDIRRLTGFPKLLCAQTIIKNNIIIDDAIYYPFIQIERTPPWFNADILRGVHFWGTITCKMINFAVYMGFKEIVLLGVDNTFSIKKNNEGNYYFTGGTHFTEDYWNDEDIKEMNKNMDNIVKSIEYVNRSYSSVKWFCDQLGVNVYNATRGGGLEIFPRRAFENF